MQMKLFLTPPKQVTGICWRSLHELSGDVFYAPVLIIIKTYINQASCLHVFSMAESEGRTGKFKHLLA